MPRKSKEANATYARRWRVLHPYNTLSLENKKKRIAAAGRCAYKRRYPGKTIRDKAALIVAQNGTCKNCKTTNPGKKGWCTHHLHMEGGTKAIVLLCGKCNLGSGYFHDSPALLRSMADINEFLAFAVLSKLKE
jgi:hypothetical protein